MPNIIVKKGGGGFHPHFNHATGRFYHTRDDYLGDLKAKGLEPFDPRAAGRDGPKRTPYKPSQWARDMGKSISETSRHGGKVGSMVIDELKRHGVDVTKPPRKDLPTQTDRGGFYDAAHEKRA